jgi:hypothetical protein
LPEEFPLRHRKLRTSTTEDRSAWPVAGSRTKV